MTFTVTYRGADGAPETDVVEATGRAECLAQMRARGVAVLGVKETRSSTTKYTKHTKEDGDGSRAELAEPRRRKDGRNGAGKKPSSVCYFLFAAIAVIAAIALWWWMDGRRDIEVAPQDEGPKKPSALAKEVKPAAAAKPIGDGTAKLSSGEQEDLGKDRSKKNAEPPKEEIISVVTNKSGYIIERVRKPDGTTAKHVHTPPPVFKHGSDQMIALVLSAPPGQAMPPMPMNAFTDDEFNRSLEENIEILDTDSDDVKDLKAKVIVARSEIKAMMAKGYSALQVLQEHQDIFNDNAKLHTDALIEMKSILDSGDREEARKYAIAMNAAFQQMGVPELPVPSKDGTAEADSRAEAARERIKERIRTRKEEIR